MPFITQERRKEIDEVGLSSVHLLDGLTPGDRCYVFYKEMVGRWRENPRWTTAHKIYKEMVLSGITDVDDFAAQNLAWQCFFYFHVLKYEELKRNENGDI